MLVCVRITRNSPSVSGPALRSSASGIPILPMSCSPAARRNNPASSGVKPMRRASSADRSPTRRLCSLVCSSRYSAASASRSTISTRVDSSSRLVPKAVSSSVRFCLRRSWNSIRLSSRLRTRSSTSTRSNGLVTKSLAPRVRAWCRTSRVPSPVTISTGRCSSLISVASRSRTQKPSRFGMCRSVITRSGGDPGSSSSRPPASVIPVTDWNPDCSSSFVSTCTLVSSSSMTTMWAARLSRASRPGSPNSSLETPPAGGKWIMGLPLTGARRAPFHSIPQVQIAQ